MKCRFLLDKSKKDGSKLCLCAIFLGYFIFHRLTINLITRYPNQIGGYARLVVDYLGLSVPNQTLCSFGGRLLDFISTK